MLGMVGVPPVGDEDTCQYVFSSGVGYQSNGRTFVVLAAHDLLDEAEEDGDDDGGLERLAEDDEEDGHGEHGHDVRRRTRGRGGRGAAGRISYQI